MKAIITTISDALMGFLSDHILDNIWADLYERQYARAAGNVAFLLAFCCELTTDEQATVASKRRAR